MAKKKKPRMAVPPSTADLLRLLMRVTRWDESSNSTVAALKISVKAPPGGSSTARHLRWLRDRDRGKPVEHDVTFYDETLTPTHTAVLQFPSVQRGTGIRRSRGGAPRKAVTRADILALKKKHPQWGARRLAEHFKVTRGTILNRLREQ